MKLCVDCKHYIAPHLYPEGYFSRAIRWIFRDAPDMSPQECDVVINPINGAREIRMALWMRVGGKCGEDAKLWEPK